MKAGTRTFTCYISPIMLGLGIFRDKSPLLEWVSVRIVNSRKLLDSSGWSSKELSISHCKRRGLCRPRAWFFGSPASSSRSRFFSSFLVHKVTRWLQQFRLLHPYKKKQRQKRWRGIFPKSPSADFPSGFIGWKCKSRDHVHQPQAREEGHHHWPRTIFICVGPQRGMLLERSNQQHLL